MKIKLFFFFLFINAAFSQHSLDYYLSKAVENSPVLKEFNNLKSFNQVQKELNHAQNKSFQLSLTGDLLFVPYLNNNGQIFSSSPSPEAIGYESALTNGGLYSTQLNLEHIIFNGKLIDALDKQVKTVDDNYNYNYLIEKHSLEKQVIDQYINSFQVHQMTGLTKEIISNVQFQLNVISNLVEKGFMNIQDFLLLKIELKNQEINLLNLQQQYKSNIYQLNFLCGIQDTTLTDLDSISLKQTNSVYISKFNQKFRFDSLNVINVQTIFETKYEPQLKVFVNAGLNAMELANIERKFGMSAGLHLFYPILDGNQKELTRQQSIISQSSINYYRINSEKNIELQKNNSLSKMNSLNNNLLLINEQINDYSKILELSNRQLEQGNVSIIDYLVILRGFFDLKKSKIDNETNYQLEVNNYNYWNW